MSKLAISSKYAIFTSQIWTFENRYAPKRVTFVTFFSLFLYEGFMNQSWIYFFINVNVLTNSFCIKECLCCKYYVSIFYKVCWLFVGPSGVYMLDFFCSGIQFNLLLSPYLCFISLLYLDLYVFGDDALISLGSFMQTKYLCVLIHI